MYRLLCLLLGLFWLAFTGCSSEGRAKLVEEDAAISSDASGDLLTPADTFQDSTTDTLVPDLCTANCLNRECGSDGCGGNCGQCPQAAPICGSNNLCEVECIPDCEAAGKECGDDGCGESCGNCPQVAPFCVDFTCAVDCIAECAGVGCGEDGCGGSCGECQADNVCEAGQCVCQPLCTDLECGDDGCGGSCGDCPADMPTCQAGLCVSDCEPECETATCGSDGCGGSCGDCPADAPLCQGGKCVPECIPDCDDADCGSDGCGGSCGTCPPKTECEAGICFDPCDAACLDKECGPNGCGGSCGICAFKTNSVCEEGACVCEFAECSDGCCAAGVACSPDSGECCPAGDLTCCPPGTPGCCEPFSWEEDFDSGEATGFTISNSGGGGLPGMEAGWSVSDACGSHSSAHALYFGMAGGMLGQCLYSIGFPGLGGFSGEATSPTIAIPSNSATLTFWYMADILPAEPTELLSLSVIHGGASSQVWSKADVAAIGPSWHLATVNLHPYAGQGIKLRFSFETSGTQQSGGKGILIDDIVVSGQCAP